MDVTNSGSDMGLMPPMIEQLKRRCPEAMIGDYLVDGGFAKHEDIDSVSAQGITVLAPVRLNPNETDKSKRFEPHEGDSDHVIAWRARMASPEAKKEYKRRASTIELTNGNARNDGLQQVRVRGSTRVKAIALWHALVQNMRLWINELQGCEVC